MAHLRRASSLFQTETMKQNKNGGGGGGGGGRRRGNKEKGGGEGGGCRTERDSACEIGSVLADTDLGFFFFIYFILINIHESRHKWPEQVWPSGQSVAGFCREAGRKLRTNGPAMDLCIL